MAPSLAGGRVIFYAPADFDGTANIPVAIGMPNGGVLHGTITRYTKTTPYSKPPPCGTQGPLTVSLEQGWYRWEVPAHRCTPSMVSEGGAVKVQAGACVQIELAKLWGCPMPRVEEK